MCWDMDIEHWNDIFLTDTDCWSRLGADLCFDPLLNYYIKQVHTLHQRSPSPTSLPPHWKTCRIIAVCVFQKWCLQTQQAPLICQKGVHLSAPIDSVPTVGFQHLLNYAIRFGTYGGHQPNTNHTSRPLYNSDITVAASTLLKFDWAVYGFNNGHFFSMITEQGMQFNIVLACNPYANDQSLLKDIYSCLIILPSAPALLNHVCASGITAPMMGYLVHSHQYTSTEPTSQFREIQAQTVIQL
jgi:hypothetical protein